MYNKVGLTIKTIKTSKEDQVVKLDRDSIALTTWNCSYNNRTETIPLFFKSNLRMLFTAAQVRSSKG